LQLPQVTLRYVERGHGCGGDVEHIVIWIDAVPSGPFRAVVSFEKYFRVDDGEGDGRDQEDDGGDGDGYDQVRYLVPGPGVISTAAPHHGGGDRGGEGGGDGGHDPDSGQDQGGPDPCHVMVVAQGMEDSQVLVHSYGQGGQHGQGGDHVGHCHAQHTLGTHAVHHHQVQQHQGQVQHRGQDVHHQQVDYEPVTGCSE